MKDVDENRVRRMVKDGTTFYRNVFNKGYHVGIAEVSHSALLGLLLEHLKLQVDVVNNIPTLNPKEKTNE